MEDDELKKIIDKGKAFIFAPFDLKTVDDLVRFEDEYCQVSSELEWL
jgi:hypothetical protein